MLTYFLAVGFDPSDKVDRDCLFVVEQGLIVPEQVGIDGINLVLFRQNEFGYGGAVEWGFVDRDADAAILRRSLDANGDIRFRIA